MLEPGQVVAQRGRVGDLQGNAAAAPVMRERLQRVEERARLFDDAKAASEMRSARTLAQAEAAAPPAADAGITSRRVSTRIFVLRDSVWTDATFKEGTRVVTVKPYSEAYFALVREIPDLGPAFALGERVLVRGTKVAVAVAPDGSERLTKAEIAAIVAAW